MTRLAIGTDRIASFFKSVGGLLERNGVASPTASKRQASPTASKRQVSPTASKRLAPVIRRAASLAAKRTKKPSMEKKNSQIMPVVYLRGMKRAFSCCLGGPVGLDSAEVCTEDDGETILSVANVSAMVLEADTAQTVTDNDGDRDHDGPDVDSIIDADALADEVVDTLPGSSAFSSSRETSHPEFPVAQTPGKPSELSTPLFPSPLSPGLAAALADVSPSFWTENYEKNWGEMTDDEFVDLMTMSFEYAPEVRGHVEVITCEDLM